MEVKLWKKPKNCTIIEGFPGFGLVGTIASEFLIEHLKTEQIGKILFDDMPAMVAIHENKVVEPLGIFYNQKYGFSFEISYKVLTRSLYQTSVAQQLEPCFDYY